MSKIRYVIEKVDEFGNSYTVGEVYLEENITDDKWDIDEEVPLEEGEDDVPDLPAKK